MNNNQPPLIGRNFKWNKYGLTHWTDTVQEVLVVHTNHTPKQYVKGKSGCSYLVGEVVFVDTPATEINVIYKTVI